MYVKYTHKCGTKFTVLLRGLCLNPYSLHVLTVTTECEHLHGEVHVLSELT